MCEGRARSAAILQRLAQREIEMKAVLTRNRAAGQRGLHRGNIIVGELHRLEVGQAPPRLTQLGHQGNRPAIGRDPIGAAPDGLEHMAIAHPDPRLALGLGQHLLVELKRIVKFADPAQRGGLQIGVAGIIGLFQSDQPKLGNRLFGPVLAVEHQGQIGPRGGEAGRQLKRAAQQRFGIAVAPDPPGQFGHQADRGDIERILFQLGTQQRLGARHVILIHRQGRLD